MVPNCLTQDSEWVSPLPPMLTHVWALEPLGSESTEGNRLLVWNENRVRIGYCKKQLQGIKVNLIAWLHGEGEPSGWSSGGGERATGGAPGGKTWEPLRS